MSTGETATPPRFRRRVLDWIALLSGWLAAVGAMVSPAGYARVASAAFLTGLAGLALVALARLLLRDRNSALPRATREPVAPALAGNRVALALLAIATVVLTIGMTIRAQLLLPLFDGGMESSAIVVNYPWLAMAMSDLYGGFILGSAWLTYRERDALWAGFLIYLLWFWGNMILGLYIIWLTLVRGASPRQVLLGWKL